MSSASSSALLAASSMNLELPGQAIQESSTDRRSDVDGKQARIAELLTQVECDASTRRTWPG
jgi:hypothetical protein